MDDVRQWLLHTAWPAMYRVRWFAAGWLVLALVAVPWGVRAQERNLESESRTALDDAGVVVDDVAFTGRNGVVTGSLTAGERARAERALAEVRGIRGIEWGVTSIVAPSPPTTTTTTPPPKEEVASLEMKVVAGRFVVRGVLPDAGSIASIGAAADRLYGPDVGNGIVVADVHPAEWSETAVAVIQTLPMVGDVTVTMDADGVTILAVAADEVGAEAFRAAVGDVLGPDVAADVAVEVSIGRFPKVEIVDAGDGTVTIAGALPRRKAALDLAAALAAVSDGAEIAAEVSIDKTLDDPYVVGRLPHLVSRLGSADSWSLTYRRGVLSGTLDGDGLFRKQTAPTARLQRVIDQLASLMVGDASLRLTVEVAAGAPVEQATDDSVGAGVDAADVELARRRSFSLLSALVRAGVDPDRVAASVAPGAGETLRFLLEPAER